MIFDSQNSKRVFGEPPYPTVDGTEPSTPHCFSHPLHLPFSHQTSSRFFLGICCLIPAIADFRSSTLHKAFCQSLSQGTLALDPLTLVHSDQSTLAEPLSERQKPSPLIHLFVCSHPYYSSTRTEMVSSWDELMDLGAFGCPDQPLVRPPPLS